MPLIKEKKFIPDPDMIGILDQSIEVHQQIYNNAEGYLNKERINLEYMKLRKKHYINTGDLLPMIAGKPEKK